jgi:3-ketoacyl-CoA synthase
VNSTGKALRANITTLGPKVLPLSEIVVFAGNLVARKVLGMRGVAPYVPDFQEAAQHICIHTGATWSKVGGFWKPFEVRPMGSS